MKSLSILILLVSSIYFSYSQDTNYFDLELEFNSEFAKNIESRMKSYKEKNERKYSKNKIPYDNYMITIRAKEDLLGELTLKQFYENLTPHSKKWFEEFFNNFKRDYMDSFDRFYEENKELTILDISQSYKNQHSKSDIHLQQPMVPQVADSIDRVLLPSVDLPKHDDIPGSKIIREYNYGSKLRYIITTPNQSIRYRCINNSNENYPDYKNYRKNFCGPAAGQSILAWFSKDVKDIYGNILTSRGDIQTRLAGQMDTRNGIDYTHPHDLYRTLIRSEYLKNSDYCYKERAKITDILYMLSNGTPVILLLSWHNKAHYITVYGYDRETNRFDCANAQGTVYTLEVLRRRWGFETISTEAAATYWLLNVEERTLFSYCNSGCNTDWDYILVNSNAEESDVYNRQVWYYGMFNDQYVLDRDENGLNFNSYAHFGGWHNGDLPTYVNSDGWTIDLNSGNEQIVHKISPNYDKIYNNSINENIVFEVGLDSKFFNSLLTDNIIGGFIVRDNNDNVILENETQLKNQIYTLNGFPAHRIKYELSYKPNYKMVEFRIHGGLRSLSWKLIGCDEDNDGDYICDEYDDDDDNDRVLDINDNCPRRSNPNQEDYDSNDLGLACDKNESCERDCTGQYYDNNPDAKTLCITLCNLSSIYSTFEHADDVIAFIHSENFQRLKQYMNNRYPPGTPISNGLKRSKFFKSAYEDFSRILKYYDPKVRKRKGKDLFYNILNESYFKPDSIDQ